ncbi:hypothetical protein ACFSKM_06010 [Ancylobacter dichloromethanicus]
MRNGQVIELAARGGLGPRDLRRHLDAVARFRSGEEAESGGDQGDVGQAHRSLHSLPQLSAVIYVAPYAIQGASDLCGRNVWPAFYFKNTLLQCFRRPAVLPSRARATARGGRMP